MKPKAFIKQKFFKNKSKGFSLVEFLVAVLIFSFVIGSAVGIFSSVVKAQRRAIATQRILDQASFAIEYLSRTIRMSESGSISLSREGQGISFRNSNGEFQEIFVENKQLQQSKLGVVDYLISPDIKVNSFSIYFPGPGVLPRITVVFSLQNSGTKPEEIVDLRVQTTISPRNFN